MRHVGLMGCALIEVQTDKTSQLGQNASIVVNVGELPTRTEVAPEVVKLV
jgi:hypothetical protein